MPSNRIFPDDFDTGLDTSYYERNTGYQPDVPSPIFTGLAFGLVFLIGIVGAVLMIGWFL